MKVFTTYFAGLRISFRSISLATILYGLNLILGLIVMIPFYNSMVSAYGSSMSLEGMIGSIEYTSFSELFNQVGATLSQFISSGIWMLLLFMLLQIFFTGGILTIIDQEKPQFKSSNFFSGCGKWFFRFLKIGVTFLLLHVVIIFLIYFPLSKLAGNSLAKAETEKTIVFLVILFLSLHAILLSLVNLITLITRFKVFISDDRKILKSIVWSVRLFLRNFISFYGLFLLLVVSFLLISFIYFLLSKLPGAATTISIILLLVVQQAFIWFRGWFRIWMISSQYKLFLEVNKK